MPEFKPRLTGRDHPVARIAEALRALFADGAGGSFIICDVGGDYAQVAGSNEEEHLYWEVARKAWYDGQQASPQEDRALRALGLAPPGPHTAPSRGYWERAPAPPAQVEELARRMWAALAQGLGHSAAELRIEVNLEEPRG